MKRKLEKIQKWNFKLAFRFGKILKIINARCGRRRFLRFWSTWSGVGHPEMPPSCLELNSDDFPFFRDPPSTSIYASTEFTSFRSHFWVIISAGKGPHFTQRWVPILKCVSPTFPLFGRSLTQCSHCAYPYIHQRSRMRNPEEPNAKQEPNAKHHVSKFLVEVLILRSICGPLKRKLMAFSCHIQLSRVPPRCVMLWRSPEMNFTRRPRVAKLLCIGSPLNRSRGVTYCTLH